MTETHMNCSVIKWTTREEKLANLYGLFFGEYTNKEDFHKDVQAEIDKKIQPNKTTYGEELCRYYSGKQAG